MKWPESRTGLRSMPTPALTFTRTLRDVRRLAFAATDAMGRENTSWHGLVRRYRDELP